MYFRTKKTKTPPVQQQHSRAARYYAVSYDAEGGALAWSRDERQRKIYQLPKWSTATCP